MNTIDTQQYRPALHFAPKQKWMNDPNGLVYFKGEYHLFFQHNPFGTTWGPMHWGHAVSKDLIHWEELDIALYPDELGTIFSGSAIIDWNNTSGFFPDEPGMVAVFTHHMEKEGEPIVQTQSLAYSHDQGRTWTKYEGNPVLTHDTKIDFRDPKVFWHKQSERWIMVLATGQTITLYSSKNLKDWKFESEFGEGIGSHAGVWECPDLFELNVEGTNERKWFLIVSIGDNPKYDEGSRTQYFIGDFDGSVFTPQDDVVRWLDFGKDNYAGVSFSDIPQEDGRRIYLGWMSNWRYANIIPTEGWRSQMTLPRSLSLRVIDNEWLAVQRPVIELNNHFHVIKKIDNKVVQNQEKFIVKDAKTSLDIELQIKNISAKRYALKFYHTKNDYSVITIDTTLNQLIFDRKKSGEVSFSENFELEQKIELSRSTSIDLRVIIDSSSIEIFVDEGSYALTSLIYPEQICEQIDITADGEIKITNGEIRKPNEI